MSKAIFFLDENVAYDGPEPYFFNPADYSWVKQLEANWTIIRDEFMPIISGAKPIKLYSPNPPCLSNKHAWKNIYLWNFMWQYHSNCRQFPKTYKLLSSIPNLTFAEFTLLEPNSSILPHIGETNTIIRGHLGISIPAGLPIAGIKVGNEERGWEDGKVVLFSDCHLHTVWNNSSQRRFVMIFDITKDEFAHQKYWVSAQSLSALTIKYFDEKFNLLKKLPMPLLNFLHKTIAVVWWVYLPVQRNFFGLFYS